MEGFSLSRQGSHAILNLRSRGSRTVVGDTTTDIVISNFRVTESATTDS